MPGDKPYRPIRNKRLDPEQYAFSYRIYFITIHAYMNKRPFINYEINRMMIDTLNEEIQRLNFILYTFCLMPDHLHYLISPLTDGNSVLSFTHQYKGKTTNRSWKLGETGKLWQPRFYDHIVRTDESLVAIANYILANPVRKGYIDNPEEWLWSGQPNPFPLD